MIQYRQGDVLLTRASGPAQGAAVAPEHGRLVLASGEATGHHHSVAASAGTLVTDEGGVLWLTIEALTAVEHQEHAPLTLEPGIYQVTRQREYSPNAIRNVAD